ncbi:MAG TPA: COX15/CtaA family protein [Gemmatimonadales bacterium]|nr:COX15/CtaA family protein [Gemmatimonadales bacterium]
MTRRFSSLAWSAAVCTYLLIVLGAVVRITGSGLGCGDHWPLCNGHLFPPLNDIGTVIEWSHRLVAALVSILVLALAFYGWLLSRRLPRDPGLAPGVGKPTAAYVAVSLLVIQVLLGAITVKLELPAWSIVLHLGTAMLLLATLLSAARARSPALSPVMVLAFVTVLFGALTANLGAAAACHGFPLCNGEIWMSAGPLAWIQWIHRLLAYSLAMVALVWALRTPGRTPKIVLGLIVLQITIGAAVVLLGLPSGLQAAHVAIGTAVWSAAVLGAIAPSEKEAAPRTSPGPRIDAAP